jgi:hypothetical protein
MNQLIKALCFFWFSSAGEIHASDSSWKNGGLYPIQAMTVPITLRFKFHFETKRETNRIDKVYLLVIHSLLYLLLFFSFFDCSRNGISHTWST